MKNKILLTGLIFAISLNCTGFCTENETGFQNIAASIRVPSRPSFHQHGSFMGRPYYENGFIRRPYGSSGFYPSGIRRYNPFWRNNLNNGVLTGFTPSISPYYRNNGIFTYNDGITQQTYVSDGRWSGLKNWFNNRFNQNAHATAQPFGQTTPSLAPSNPYVNGNYNTNQNKKYMQFFDTNNSGGLGGSSSYNPYGDDNSGTASGCSVTIID